MGLFVRANRRATLAFLVAISGTGRDKYGFGLLK